MSKLIIIRGNSGSGKSTIAEKIRENLTEKKVALVGQDNLRRHVMGEIGKGGDDNVELIEITVRFALEKGYVVVLEGILNTKYYGEMIKRLWTINPKQTHIYYLDISIEETLERHKTKPNCNEFGEEEMREWYRDKDLLGFEGEISINEESSLEESVGRVLQDIS